MRKSNKIPRIIKINEITGFNISCAFNNGEHRIIDFRKLFKIWNLKEGDFGYEITQEEIFKMVEIVSNTLSWPSITKKIKLSNGMEFDAPYELDPVVLYENSELDDERNSRYYVGDLLKNARKSSGLTQEELAIKSGTTKNYISRIENNHSDIELGTLRKIIEIGLDKKLDIQIS
jgi:DNA-binding XRE family transcriptional regulator